MEQTKKYIIRWIVVVLATAVDAVAIFAQWNMVGIFGLLAYLAYLSIPLLVKQVALLFVIAATGKHENRQDKVLFYWAIAAMSAVIINVGIHACYDNQARNYYKLPDDTTLTVWQEKIIFDKYTSLLPPKSNCIRLPKNLTDWEMIIDTTGHLTIWVEENATEIKIFSPKYAVGATYEKAAGKYWYRTENRPEHWIANYTYHYDKYGGPIFSGAEMSLSTIVNDSVFTQHWYTYGADHIKCFYSGTDTCALDSFCRKYHNNTEDYYSRGQDWGLDGKHMTIHYADSIQYSAKHWQGE